MSRGGGTPRLQPRAGVAVDFEADANFAQPRSLPSLHGQLSQLSTIVGLIFFAGSTDNGILRFAFSGCQSNRRATAHTLEQFFRIATAGHSGVDFSLGDGAARSTQLERTPARLSRAISTENV